MVEENLWHHQEIADMIRQGDEHGARSMAQLHIRTFNAHYNKEKSIIPAEAFNIKAESLRLGNFSREDILGLYSMHGRNRSEIRFEFFLP